VSVNQSITSKGAEIIVEGEDTLGLQNLISTTKLKRVTSVVESLLLAE